MDEIFKKYIEEDYKDFSNKLIPNSKILGIRTNNLKLIAKEYVKNNDLSILNKELEYHEEMIVYMLILSNLKDINLIYNKLDEFVPKMNNWAVCDCLMNIKIIRKNREFFYPLINKYKTSNKEFEARFALVMLLSHYMDIKYLDDIFNIIEEIDKNYYYTKMAAAWLIAECFIKFRDYTINKFNNLNVDNFTYNKAISKICDSYRVTKEDKEYLKTLRRK